VPTPRVPTPEIAVVLAPATTLLRRSGSLTKPSGAVPKRVPMRLARSCVLALTARLPPLHNEVPAGSGSPVLPTHGIRDPVGRADSFDTYWRSEIQPDVPEIVV